MSVSKWRYTEECNGRPCPGDCDHCSFEPTDLISRADAIEAVIAQRHKAELSDYNFALGLAEDAIRRLPSAETHEIRTETHGVCLISKDDAMGAVQDHFNANGFKGYDDGQKMMDRIKALPSADAEQGKWIPCGEKMPKELERVNVTWLNHNPPFYYQHIKDIPQTDTAVYYRGKWYWWDATVIDVLAEYGEDCNAEQIGKDIEVVAWMPLPKPYKGGDDE